MKVLRTNDTWYGMTYKEDVMAVRDSLKKCLKREYIRQICFRICDILEPWEITVALCFILREKAGMCTIKKRKTLSYRNSV